MTNETPPPAAKRNRRRLTAYDMLFEGRTYKEIAAATQWDEGHLKNRLGPSGKWYPDYMLWANDKADAIEREVRLRIKKRLNESMTVLEVALTLINKDARTAVKAANSILDRGGLKAPEKIEVSNPYDQAEKLAQWIENKNKPKPPNDE